ncbi:MAG: leucine-rich repeat protein [Christensenellales bacterium]
MRKRIIFILLSAMAILSVFALSACASGDADVVGKKVTSVTAISSHEGDYVIGEEVDLSEIIIKTVYSDGTETVVNADEFMLDEENRAKFYTKGIHTVVFDCDGKGLLAMLQISVIERAEEETYLASFFSNGGSSVPNQTTNVIKAFVNPVRQDYKFDGWYTTPDFSGSRAVAPYVLTQNTDFYAKWVDNRRCNVKFYDGEDLLYDFDVVYGTGIDIRDLEKYPAPPEKAGKIFTGWTLASGSNLDEIVSDTVVSAGYESVKCVVNIEYFNGETVVLNPYTLNYGEIFDVSAFTMPQKEGHTSRWVLYRGDSEKFEEIEDLRIVVTDEKITIKPEHVIDKYYVTVFNGAPESAQKYEDLKSGSVALQQVYYNAEAKTNFRVEYGSDFNLSEYNQEPNLTKPEEIYGYTAVWCYVVSSSAGEIWYNANNEIWDEASGSFVADGESTTNFSLYDKNGSYIARIFNGDVKEIKGDVLIKPKYLKKTYKIQLQRLGEKGWSVIDSFNKEYLSDFRLYSPDEHDGAFANAKEVEYSYHKNNVPDWSFDSDVTDSWKQIYFNGNSDDDFDVKWYTSSSLNKDTEIDFTEGADGLPGSYEITGDLTLYCEDIDLRRYTVTIRYGYDFATGEYKYVKTYDEIKENAAIVLPEEATKPITRDYGGGRTVQYDFLGWYDYPYDPDGNYSGVSGTDFITRRTNNVFYYVHYKCNTTYTLEIYDKTQKDAYTGIPGYDGAHYDVPEKTIVYNVPAGTNVTLDMIFKGRLNADETIMPGQTYYERYSYIKYFDSEYTDLYDSIIAEYAVGGTVEDAKNALNAVIAEKQGRADRYENLLARIYSYSYDGVTKEYFLSTYMSVGEYQVLRKEIKTLNDKLEVLDTYLAKKAVRDEYADADNLEAANGGLYKKYSDSAYHLNLAYGHDIKADPDDYKFTFAGWFSDSTYSTIYSKNIEFEWFAGENLTLYAKWADEEKGTEGLVFREVRDEGGNVIGLAVADFMNRADYEASDIYGCGYNDFTDGNEYSVNLNDQGGMPEYLGENIDVQIPATHGGSNSQPLPVIGILKGAFSRHGQVIRSISLPNNIRFAEEDAFVRCNLVSISNNGSDYVYSDEEIALYQNKDFVYAVGGERRNAVKNVLIVYANRNERASYAVRSETARIGDDAFYLASALKEVVFAASVVSIGRNAFSGSGLTGVLNLPDGLVTIEAEAFSNCTDVKNVVCGTSINSIGKNAFKNTGWFIGKVGIVALNGILIGVRSADGNTFDKDVGGDYVISDVNGQQAYSYTNEYGAIYYSVELRSVVKIAIRDTVKSIAPNAMEGIVGAIEEITIDGTLEGGIGSEAFKNCSISKVVFAAADSACEVASDAFAGCSSLTVYVTDKDAIHSSWYSCVNITVKNL